MGTSPRTTPSHDPPKTRYNMENFIVQRCQHKEDVPNWVTYLNETPTFKWYVVRCGSKNVYKKDICLKDIRLHAHNVMIHSRLNSQHNWGDLYGYLIRYHHNWVICLNEIFILELSMVKCGSKNG